MDDELQSKGISMPFRFLIVGCAVLPFVASLGALSQGTRTQDVDQSANRPGLTFNQYMVNLGSVEHKQYAYARFSFANTGDETVTVKELIPSCGCLNPQLNKFVFEPGEAGGFLLRVHTPGETPGDKEYFVRMKYEDSEPREVVLTFKMTLPEPQLVVEPKALIFYQQGGAGGITHEIVITDHEKTGMHLVGALCSADGVSVEIGKVDMDAEGHPRMRVNVTIPEEVSTKAARGVISIFTDNPLYGTLRVPLIVQGFTSSKERTASGKPGDKSERD